MKASFFRLLFTALLLASLGSTLTSAEYRVILRDGSWLRAQSKPVVKDGQAQIRLLAGQLTAIPEERINWQASESWNRSGSSAAVRPEGSLPTPVKPVPASIRMVRDPDDTAAAESDTPSDANAAGEPAAKVEPQPTQPIPIPEQQVAQLRERIRALDNEIAALRERKADLEERARRSVKLDETNRLTAQAQAVQDQIRSKRGEQNRLILQLPGRKP